MNRVVSLASTPTNAEAVLAAFELIAPPTWDLSFLDPSLDPRPDPPGTGAAADPPGLSDHLRAEELTWVLRDGAKPAAGSFEAIEYWHAERPGATFLYGDSMSPAGITVNRPRYETYSFLSLSPTLGGFVVGGTDDIPSGIDSDSPLSWVEMVTMVAHCRTVEHIPVVLEDLTDDVTIETVVAQARTPDGVRLEWTEFSPLPIPTADAGEASVSIVIPTIGATFDIDGEPVIAAARCIESLQRFDSRLLTEIILVCGEAMDAGVLDSLCAMDPRVTPVHVDGAFNFSYSCNTGAIEASGTHILFLNDDVEVRGDGWLEILLGIAHLPGVGAVGAELLFPGEAIQHAGISMNPETSEPFHVYYGAPLADAVDPIVTGTIHTLAVTGACLLVSAADVRLVGGFTLGLPRNYNDVDFCLKLWLKGKKTLCCNQLSFIHRESTSREPSIEDFERDWMRTWEPAARHDPLPYAWS